MTPVAFGVIHAALRALDADLTPERIEALDDERRAAAFHAAAEVRDAADHLYTKLRDAIADTIIDASHGRPAA